MLNKLNKYNTLFITMSLTMSYSQVIKQMSISILLINIEYNKRIKLEASILWLFAEEKQRKHAQLIAPLLMRALSDKDNHEFPKSLFPN